MGERIDGDAEHTDDDHDDQYPEAAALREQRTVVATAPCEDGAADGTVLPDIGAQQLRAGEIPAEAEDGFAPRAEEGASLRTPHEAIPVGHHFREIAMKNDAPRGASPHLASRFAPRAPPAIAPCGRAYGGCVPDPPHGRDPAAPAGCPHGAGAAASCGTPPRAAPSPVSSDSRAP
ncbi:MAG: hypothetical protein KIT14_23755 [bacterium]|nr:hypothetical protein [bacterium]